MIATIREDESVSIRDLPFTDLYLPLVSGVRARFRPDPIKGKRTGNFEVPDTFREDLDEIRQMVQHAADDDGTITYKGLRLRYVRFEAAENEMWIALRAVPLDLPSLETLHMDRRFIRTLRGWGNKRGLVLVGGKTGDGKTTTCVAAIKDHLERYGGFAYTVEDPPEYQMQGAISPNGFCLQVEIKDDTKWGEAVKRAMRCRPDILFLGEIRTPEAAEHLLKAVTSGHLVFTTVHAGSVPDTIGAIIQLAESRMPTKTVRAILADRLVAAIYQTMTKSGPSITLLEPKSGPNEQTVSILTDGDLSKLNKHCVRYDPAPNRQVGP